MFPANHILPHASKDAFHDRSSYSSPPYAATDQLGERIQFSCHFLEKRGSNENSRAVRGGGTNLSLVMSKWRRGEGRS